MPTDPSKQHIDTNKNVYVTAMPEWKQALWRDISLAAKAKNAFEDDDYDKNGDLDSNFTKFAEICTWLAARRSKAQFETLRPAWRYVPDSDRWKLIFHAVRGTSAAEQKQIICLKSTGVTVEGLTPIDRIGEDWVVLRSEKIPSQEELLKEGAKGEGYCFTM